MAIARIHEVALHCQAQAAATGNSVAGAVREFLAAYSRPPADMTTGYYAAYTAQKDWDVVMTDFWKCAASDPTQRNPEMLCYDYTDMLILILGYLGIWARSVRGIAVKSGWIDNGHPVYMDHVFAEVWMSTKWSAQDGYYNCEYLIDGYYASADDLCGAGDLDTIIPRNKPLFTGSWQTGWDISNLSGTLRSQDFYAAIEHRDDAGNSVVVMNGNRGDFGRLHRTAPASALTPLRDLIISSVKHPVPTVIEIKPL